MKDSKKKRDIIAASLICLSTHAHVQKPYKFCSRPFAVSNMSHG